MSDYDDSEVEEFYNQLKNVIDLKRISKPKRTKLKFDLKKLKDPKVLETLQAVIVRKFPLLTIMNNEVVDMDLKITTFNTAVTETTSDILGKHCQRKNLGHHRNSLPVQQRESTEKETI